MKHITAVMILGLLAGCSLTNPLNGTYDVDKEYKARGTADVIESAGKLPMPKEEFIQKYIEEMKTTEYEAIIEYPSLKMTFHSPNKPPHIVVFNLEKIHYHPISPVSRE